MFRSVNSLLTAIVVAALATAVSAQGTAPQTPAQTTSPTTPQTTSPQPAPVAPGAPTQTAPSPSTAAGPLPKTTLTIEPTPKGRRSTETLILEPVLKINLDAAPSAAAAIDESTAFVPLKSGRFVAVDLDRGTIRWAIDLVTNLPPAISDDLVVVAGDELLTGLDVKTGAARWRVPVTGGFSAPPLADSGWVIATATGGDVLTLRASDGHVLWTSALGASVRVRPAIAADAAYFSLENSHIASLELLTGKPRWDRLLPGKPGDLLVLDDRLFVGGDDKWFYCLNTKNGDERWRKRVGGKSAGVPAIDVKRVYYVALDNMLWVLDRNTGVMKWKQALPVRPSGGPIIVGGVVVIAGVAFEIYGYRVEQGENAGNVILPADLAMPPMVLPGETVALASIAMFTREGEFQVLKRRLEPRPIPFPYPFGTEIPLTELVAPPAPIASAPAAPPSP
jgi:outer membrane protein assembly factor BamB